MEQQQISAKKQKALDKVKRANAELAKVVREEKEQLRKAQDRHKYMMGGCVVKYFPEAYDFTEQEMNRIIACAFSLKDVKNMITKVANTQVIKGVRILDIQTAPFTELVGIISKLSAEDKDVSAAVMYVLAYMRY